MCKKLLSWLIIVFWGMTEIISAQTSNGFWEAIPGLYGAVDIIRINGNDLIVGGLFSSANGDSNASHIAKWNGTGWEAFGTGLDDWCTSIAFLGNDMYAGGSFSSAGDQPHTAYIARWDGTKWNSVGGGLNLHVNALAVKDSDLIVGGVFRNAGGNPDADRIAKWNGSSWEAMDKGLGGWVFTIAVNNGEIYAGGQFTSAAGDTNVKYIAKWNDVDSVWEPFGNGLNHQVHHIGFHNNEMYIGGYFTDAGGDPDADRIARWNGTSWEGLGPGLNGDYDFAEVEEFAFDGDDIYVTGLFNIVGSDSTFSNIAKWNGTSWEKLGYGFNQETRSLVIFNNDLYLGGSFSAEGPGGKPDIYYLARWINTSTSVNDNDHSVISGFRLFQNYPNPFNPSTKIKFTIAAVETGHALSLQHVTLKVYDILGNEVAELVNEMKPAGTYEITFNAGSLSSQIYFYRLTIDGKTAVTRKMILTK